MYNNISSPDTALGNNLGGVCSFQFVPKEWIEHDVKLDLNTGTVITAPGLIAGRSWVPASCMDSTMEYEEKEKREKGGSYIEGTLSGILYKDEIERHVNLATLRFHEFVVIYTDANGQRRIIGNKQKGMSFLVDYITGRERRTASVFTISLVHQLAEPAPIFIGTLEDYLYTEGGSPFATEDGQSIPLDH